MAVLALGLAGAAIGSAGTFVGIGATIGWSVGPVIGGIYERPLGASKAPQSPTRLRRIKAAWRK